MKLFTLGLCSIILGTIGSIMLPAYFWMFVFCIFMGFFCQLASFWQAHKERREIISRMTDRQEELRLNKEDQ